MKLKLFQILNIGLVILFALISSAWFANDAQANSTITVNPTVIMARPLQQTRWIATARSGDIAYFLFNSSPRIERYDLSTQKWLTTITLTDIPTAFAVDTEGIYISFNRRTARFALDGTGETHLYNTSEDVTQLFTINQFLYIMYSYKNIAGVNKFSGTLVGTNSYFYGMTGISVAPTKGKAFGRSNGISPADILQITLNADGTLGNQTDSPYHGDYPSATQTYMFPNEARVVDSAGIVYNTSNLSYSSSLGGAIDDVTFYGDLPIVLRKGTLYAYSNTLLETGKFTPLDHPPVKIFVQGETIYSFYVGGALGIEAAPIDIHQLNPDKPNEAINPTGLHYTPDYIELGKDEIVYLLSKANLTIFRWSIAERRYLDSIPLIEAPDFMAYSGSTNRIYLAYSSGKITQIDLSQNFTEQPIINSPEKPLGLATAGNYIFVCDGSGAWVSHFTYSSEGTLISNVEWNYYSKEYIWSAANQKMYFFRDDTSPNDVIWEEIGADGKLGSKKDSPYHDSAGIKHPIRVAPNGSIVLLGSGRIYNADNLEQINALSNEIVDATWLSNNLFTLKATTSTEVQQWGINYGLSKTFKLSDTPKRLLTIGEGLLLITTFDGLPRFIILDNTLNQIYASPTLEGLQVYHRSDGLVGRTIIFTTQFTIQAGQITYNWDFGDNKMGTGSQAGHVYANPGHYKITLTATNQVDTLTATTAITITDVPISGLMAQNNSPIEVNRPITFMADVNGGTNVQYAWTFGDGEQGIGNVITHSYATPGAYIATVKATNSVNSLSATTAVSVEEKAVPLLVITPTQLSFIAHQNDTLPQVLSFTIQSNKATLAWTATTTASWLSLSDTQGTSPYLMQLSAMPISLPTGIYTGYITLQNTTTVTNSEIVTVILTVQPPLQRMTLKADAGYKNIRLEWTPTNNPLVTHYRVLRSENNTLTTVQVATTTELVYFDESPNLIKGKTYCYKIEALEANTVFITSDLACATLGELSLWIPNRSGAISQTVLIPVNIRNADSTQIAASDIWLEFDSSVLEPIGVLATPLTVGYLWGYQIKETNHPPYKQAHIAALSSVPPTLYGSGSLFLVQFRVIGQMGRQSSLNLQDFVTGVGGSTIYTPDDLFNPIALELHDGLFSVANSYTLGDLNGNGLVEAVDAYIALALAVDKITPTANQKFAGDTNGDGVVDAADAAAIFYYLTHQTWPTVSSQRALQATATSVTLTLGNVQAQPGSTVTTTLQLNNASNWSGGKFVIAYDTHLVEKIVNVSVAAATANFALDYNDNKNGLLYVALADDAAINVNGAIMQVSFKIASNLTTNTQAPLTLADVRLSDALGRDFTTSALQTTLVKNNGVLSINTTPQHSATYLPVIVNGQK